MRMPSSPACPRCQGPRPGSIPRYKVNIILKSVVLQVEAFFAFTAFPDPRTFFSPSSDLVFSTLSARPL
jgi:hypothetical protein